MTENLVVGKPLIGSVDGEHGYLSRCVCGKEYGYWEVVLKIYPDMPTEMDCCGRSLYFKIETEVLEVPTKADDVRAT